MPAAAARVRTGFSRIVFAESYEQACRMLARLHRTGHADGEEDI